MKKYIYLLILLLAFFPSLVSAQTYSQEEIEKGSYVIGTYLFNKNQTANYDGTLTTPMIMLASKSIDSDNLNDMVIYYKNSRGRWINAITGQALSSVPNSFNITCINLDCVNDNIATNFGYDTYSNSNVSNGVYLIGKYLFNKEQNDIYDGTLTTPMIMLASKSIESNNLSDMIIYYKNSRGRWVNAITGQVQDVVPDTFKIGIINLVPLSNPTNPLGKKDSIITLSETSGTIVYGETRNIPLTFEGDGEFSCLSSDNNIATCSVSGTMLTITPKASYTDSSIVMTIVLGEGTNYNETTAIYTATVIRPSYSCVIKSRFQKADGSYAGEIERVNKTVKYGDECSWNFAGNANYQAASFNEIATSDISEVLMIDRHANGEEHALNICERHKNDETIDYESFRELEKWDSYKVTVGNNSVFDDYYLIRAAHECANKYNIPVVLKDTNEYNIYKLSKTVDDNLVVPEPIVVGTSTDFNNSTIYIHDDNFKLSTTGEKEEGSNTCTGFTIKILDDSPVFSVTNRDPNEYVTLSKQNYTSIINRMKNNSVFGNYAYIKLTNWDKYNDGTNDWNVDTVFRTADSNESYTTKTDAFRVRLDENGDEEILDKLFWNLEDYDQGLTVLPNKAVLSKIPDDKLVLTNGNFVTVISSNSETVDMLKCVKGNTSRNIAISRSNIEVSNMSHHYENNQGRDIDTLTYGYTGFFRFYNLADAVFKDSVVAVADGYSNIQGNSIYGFVMYDVVNMEVNNVSMYKIRRPLDDSDVITNPDNYELTADGTMKQLTDKFVLTYTGKNKGYWGVNGTDNCKNIVFDNVTLNRIDSHSAIMDLTVKNSTIGVHSITVTGTGAGTGDYNSGNYQNDNTLTIENVTVLSDSFVALRNGYGSTWNGTIKIKNGTLKPTEEQIDSTGNLRLILWRQEDDWFSSPNRLHNYGYNLYLPYINMQSDFTIDTSYLSANTVNNLHFYTYTQPDGYFENLKMVRDNLKRVSSSVGQNPDRSAYETEYDYFVPTYTPVHLTNSNIPSSVYIGSKISKGESINYDTKNIKYNSESTFNKYSISYKSEVYLKGTITYRNNDGVYAEEFYLEPSSNNTLFNSYIDGGLFYITDYSNTKLPYSSSSNKFYLGQKNTITSIQFENIDDKDGYFEINSFSTLRGANLDEILNINNNSYYTSLSTDDRNSYYGQGTFFIGNNNVKLGLSLIWGGSINHISANSNIFSDSTLINNNLINRSDSGRLVQSAYYGKKYYNDELFANSEIDYRYDPLQGGDVLHTPKIIDLYVHDNQIIIITKPSAWKLENNMYMQDNNDLYGGHLTDTYISTTYIIHDNYIEVNNKFVDFTDNIDSNDRKSHETPAFYAIYDLDQIAYLDNNSIIIDSLKNLEETSGVDWKNYWNSWIGLFKSNEGLGIYVPNYSVSNNTATKYLRLGFNGKSGENSYHYIPPESEGNLSDHSLSVAFRYITLISHMYIHKNTPVDYTYLITLGNSSKTLNEINNYNQNYNNLNTKEYKLTIDPNGGSISGNTTAITPDINLQYNGGNWSQLPVPVRNGYTFVGYYNAKYFGTMVYDQTGKCINDLYWNSSSLYIGDSDLTVYARWKKNNNVTYDISLDLYGGKLSDNPSSIVYIYDAIKNGSSDWSQLPIPTRSGYTFTGYYLLNGTQVYDSNGISIVGDYWINSSGNHLYNGNTDLELYAHWQ